MLAELAVKRVLHGRLPAPDYPAALRARAPQVWWGRADRTFDYARANHAPHGRVTQCAGLVAQATAQAAHAVLAARGQWITNEKQLLTRADLRQVDDFISAASPHPDALRDLVDSSRALAFNSISTLMSELSAFIRPLVLTMRIIPCRTRSPDMLR